MVKADLFPRCCGSGSRLTGCDPLSKSDPDPPPPKISRFRIRPDFFPPDLDKSLFKIRVRTLLSGSTALLSPPGWPYLFSSVPFEKAAINFLKFYDFSALLVRVSLATKSCIFSVLFLEQRVSY